MSEDVTPILFRLWRGGLIALMPYDVADLSPRHCMSYQHVGQHGAADPLGIVEDSRPAAADDYGPLLSELQSIGYEVKVLGELPEDAEAERRRSLRAYEGAV